MWGPMAAVIASAIDRHESDIAVATCYQQEDSVQSP